MSERIIIEFNDDEPKKKPEEKIVISFDDSEELQDSNESPDKIIKNSEAIEIEKPEETYEEKLMKTKLNSFYKGSSGLNDFYESGIKFPEGIENSFRKNFSINLNDEFFNSILENNKYIVLASQNSNVYFIDRFNGKVKNKIYFENESFEKTGIVHENKVYINSLRKIFEINYTDFSHMEVYNSDAGSYIWSNLNRCADRLVILEYNYQSKKSVLKIINVNNTDDVQQFVFDALKFVSDKICIANNCAYVLFDNSLLEYDLDKMNGTIHKLNNKQENKKEIRADESSFIFYLNYKLFITTDLYELYYIDLPSIEYSFKFSGIKSNYINSAGGFDDNLFLGTIDGWKFFKISGLPVYSFEDEYENKIESISRNIIVVSQKNKIVFCNLNRFQEAEGFVISSAKNNESVEIISSVISGNEIFVLTKNGIFESYTNDKFNVHI